MVLSILYFLDLVFMIILYGAKSVFMKKTYALRLEIFYLLAQVVGRVVIGTREDKIRSVAVIFEVVILFRNLRITSFLEELEQWKFFVKAIKVMQGPFFNLIFTLYSLYMFYTLVGMELFGGKINSASFERIFEANDDSDIGEDYIWLNFNDYSSGLLTLFSMMLFNNW